MTSDFTVHMDEYLPLREVVFNTLRQAILKGELKPGERLMEIALAEKLGVSRTPIREAMRKLELEGLVVMVPRRGAQTGFFQGKLQTRHRTASTYFTSIFLYEQRCSQKFTFCQKQYCHFHKCSFKRNRPDCSSPLCQPAAAYLTLWHRNGSYSPKIASVWNKSD